MSRVIGLDIGEARTGIAISDELGLTARPLETVETGRLGQRLSELLDEFSGARLVVGRPRSLDGSLGPQAARTKEIVAGLNLERPVTYEDETGTTQAAGTGGTDADAACVMLQGYLDEQFS